MLSLKIEKHSVATTFSFICPKCLEEMYFYGIDSSQTNCYFCEQDVTEIARVVNDGVDGRILYHKVGFPKMDRLGRERVKELREKCEVQ